MNVIIDLFFHSYVESVQVYFQKLFQLNQLLLLSFDGCINHWSTKGKDTELSSNNGMSVYYLLETYAGLYIMPAPAPRAPALD